MSAPVRLATSGDRYAADVVATLRDLLARAEAGEFVSCVVALEQARTFEVTYRVTGVPDLGALVGRLHVLAHMLTRKALGES